MVRDSTERTGSGGRHRRQRWSWFAAGFLTALGLVVLAALLWSPALLAYRGYHPVERALGRWAIDRIAAQRSASIVPPDSHDPRAAETGRIVYVGACAPCHGADADGRGWLGPLTYPPASALNDADTRERSDAELYWVIAEGLSFVGMPGFRDRLTDEQIWAVVAYLRSLGEARVEPLVIPTPSAEDLARADPRANGAARGAALYVSLGCVQCHGAGGNAPGRLQLRAADRRAVQAIREGREGGMPAYDTTVLSDDDLSALLEYIRTFRRRG